MRKSVRRYGRKRRERMSRRKKKCSSTGDWVIGSPNHTPWVNEIGNNERKENGNEKCAGD